MMALAFAPDTITAVYSALVNGMPTIQREESHRVIWSYSRALSGEPPWSVAEHGTEFLTVYIAGESLFVEAFEPLRSLFRLRTESRARELRIPPNHPLWTPACDAAMRHWARSIALRRPLARILQRPEDRNDWGRRSDTRHHAGILASIVRRRLGFPEVGNAERFPLDLLYDVAVEAGDNIAADVLRPDLTRPKKPRKRIEPKWARDKQGREFLARESGGILTWGTRTQALARQSADFADDLSIRLTTIELRGRTWYVLERTPVLFAGESA